MLSLVYVSAATQSYSPQELDALLEKSRHNNTRDGISGMLIYRDGDFLQVLEGPEEAVRTAFARIAKDARHQRIMMLDESRIEQRAFGEWSMGFRRLNAADCPEGFVDFFNRNTDLAALVRQDGEAGQYLDSFRKLA